MISTIGQQVVLLLSSGRTPFGDREILYLQAIAWGMDDDGKSTLSNRQIANRTGMAFGTVKGVASKVRKKLGSSNVPWLGILTRAGKTALWRADAEALADELEKLAGDVESEPGSHSDPDHSDPGVGDDPDQIDPGQREPGSNRSGYPDQIDPGSRAGALSLHHIRTTTHHGRTREEEQVQEDWIESDDLTVFTLGALQNFGWEKASNVEAMQIAASLMHSSLDEDERRRYFLDELQYYASVDKDLRQVTRWVGKTKSIEEWRSQVERATGGGETSNTTTRSVSDDDIDTSKYSYGKVAGGST